MNPVLIYLMRIEGISVNIEGAPNEKQWAKILEWTEELKAAQALQSAPPASAHPQVSLAAPVGNGADADLMAKVAELKRAGQANSGATPVAMDAGPPPAMQRKR